jgi:hypothetical protein
MEWFWVVLLFAIIMETYRSHFENWPRREG